MCRLFAQAAASPASARDLLVDSEFSLLRQADVDPANPQTDGWGLAWFDESGPRVVKSAKPAPAEREAFARAADGARSRVVIGHIRAASKGIPVDEAHTHPFSDEGWAFAHNGTLTIWREVREALGPRARRLKTDGSDSEVYFQQFLKHLARTKDPSSAFEACVRENWELWSSCRGNYPDAATPYTSLNALASDGKGLHALCHASRRGLAECGLCHPDQPWSVMSVAERDGRVVLASEGLDRGSDWSRMSPPETISAVPAGSRVELRRRPLKLTNAQGPVPEVSRK